MNRWLRRMMLGVVGVAIALSLTPAGAIPPPVYGGSCHEDQDCVCVNTYSIHRNTENKTQPIEWGVSGSRCYDPPGF
jgi:hypothetical protein